MLPNDWPQGSGGRFGMPTRSANSLDRLDPGRAKHRMTNSQRLATVRQCLNRWLARQSTQVQDELEESHHWRESILVRDGFYCGRRFVADAYEAIWFLEEDELKISNHLGEVLGAYTPQEISEWVAALPEDQTTQVQQEQPRRAA